LGLNVPADCRGEVVQRHSNEHLSDRMNTFLLGRSLTHLSLELNRSRQATLLRQERRFRSLLRHAYLHSEFYRRHYHSAGIRGGDLDAIPLRDLPTITKSQVMESFDSLSCDPALRREGVERFVADPTTRGRRYLNRFAVVHSSGSSGTVGLFVYGPEEWSILGALTISRVGRSSVRPLHRTRLAFVGATDGHYAGITLSREAPRFLYEFRPLSIQAPIEQIVAELNAFQPDMINGYASGAHLLAIQQLHGRLRISPRAIVCSGDPLTDLVRSHVQEAFGIEPINLYASSESICMGVQRNGGEDMSLFDDWHVFEIVDERLKEVGPGETGRLVLTNLYNRTQPLIRYEMSDLLTRGDDSRADGHPFQRIRALSGRSEESLSFVVNGQERKLSPHVLGEFFVPGLEKFQYEHHPPDLLLMRAKVRHDGAPVRDRIHEKMHDILVGSGLHETLRFRLEIVDRIDNDARTGKFRLIERR